MTIEIRIFHHQPYGRIEMEIELELDNGFVCDFEPDFRVQANRTDQTKVSWRLPNRKSSLNVEFLCEEFSTESPTDSTVFSWTVV